MKRLMLALVLTTASFSWSQQLQKVYSFSKDNHELSWYEMQQRLWKAEIDKNNKNGDAWLNYYRATRALRHMAPHQTDNWNQEKYDQYNKELSDILKLAEKAIPKTFEFYVISGAEKGLTFGGGEEYMKAAKMRPFDEEILDEMMIHYDLKMDEKNKIVYANKMLETNQLSVGILNWGYNILAELDENAILFTRGDNDTYATWVVQEAKKFRKDVTIINQYLIQDESYRNNLFKKLGYAPLALSFEGLVSDDQLKPAYEKLFEHFYKGKRPVYFTNTQNEYTKNVEDKLFLTGLGLKYSDESFDNVAVIKRNFEKRYLLDYITEIFACHISDQMGIYFNGMYLPAMIKLYQHYAASEELEHKNSLEKLMLKIAEQNGKLDEVNTILGTK